jgi:FkbM family methyltransferase
VIAEHSTFLAALECGAEVETAIERAFGWQLELVDPQMALSQIDQIVIRRLNDFLTRSEQPLILDCGANIGISVLNYKRRFPAARIKAFEPDAAICRVLRHNLERNGAGDVEVVEAAVWTRAGEAAFMPTGTDGGRIERRPRRRDLPRVATVDLREYLNEPVDLLKLDVEGAEYELVHHIREALHEVANLVLECHLDQATLAPFGKLLNELRSQGFHLSLNTFGRWSDLVRRSPVEPPYSEQYLALYGCRPEASLPPSASSFVPYIDLSLLMEFNRVYNRRGAPQSYRHDASSHDAGIELDTQIELFGPFNFDEGFCWTVALPDSLPEGDTNGGPAASTIVLLEDHQPLGPPHTQHAVIRNYGGGRFSHWHRTLFFSTSDDSDPNSNGRSYSIGIPKMAPAPEPERHKAAHA